MHRVLQIHETISMIFSLSDKPTLAAAARTTTVWSELALDKLWVSLDSLFPLLDLLGELRLVRIYKRDPSVDTYRMGLLFIDPLGPDGWARFVAMGNRVKSLLYNDNGRANRRWGAPVSRDIFILLSRQQQAGLLPNLKVLRWHALDESLPYLPLFLSSSLRHIDIEISDRLVHTKPIDDLFSSIIKYSPLLEGLNLKTFLGVEFFQGPLIRLFSTVKTLRSVILPMRFAAEGIISALAVQPRLQELGHNITLVPYRPSPPACIHRLRPNWFQGLTKLSFSASMCEAGDLFRSPHHPPLLQYLGIVTSGMGTVTVKSLDDVLTLIARNYPRLEGLSINLQQGYKLGYVPVSYNTLTLLFPCRQLLALEIQSNYPVQLTKDQIAEMGKSWPNLTSLFLCDGLADPAGRSGGVPLAMLPLFSCFEKIAKLGLSLDTSNPPPCPPTQFLKLELLSVGHSAIKAEDVQFTAAFLCYLLAPDADLRFRLGVYSIGSYNAVDPLALLDNLSREEKWEEVVRAAGLSSPSTL